MKNDILITGSISDINGTELKIINSFPAIPNIFNTEYTVSIYATITPKIINIHALSLVFGHNKIARNAAAAPNISWVETNTACPASIKTVLN